MSQVRRMYQPAGLPPALPEGSFTRLKSGEWGVRLAGSDLPVAKGDTVTVTVRKKSGDAEAKQVKVLWVGRNNYGPGQCALCAVVANGGVRPSRYGRRGGKYSCGYPCPVGGHICTDDNPCHDCR